MKKIVIIGARSDGHAKVVLHILLAMKTYEIVGFIDDDPTKTNQQISGYKILGTMNQLQNLIAKHTIEYGIVAIGDNLQRMNLASVVQSFGLELANAIHPSVLMDSDVKIGNGNYFGQNVVIVTGTEVGDCVNIHTGTTIDHDNCLANGVNIGPGSHTAGRVTIGKNSTLGTGSIVIPDIKIGENVLVAAGSVVINDIASSKFVAGVPALEKKRKIN